MFWRNSRFSRLGSVLMLTLVFGLTGGAILAQCPDDDEFTTEFRLQDCRFKAQGSNPYFILEPGYRLILEGEDEGEELVLWVTVLNDIEFIDATALGLGIVKTRVVEEREWVDGELEEVSRNFFVLCEPTNDVFYFGEEVDPPGGSWRVGVNGALPGLIMPGRFLLGSKYFQEIAAADFAVDRGENTEMGLDVSVEAGDFTDCVEVIDTNPAELVCDAEEGDSKVYCPGIGLVIDEDAELTWYGFVPPGQTDGEED